MRLKNPDTFDHAIFASSTPKQDRIRAWAEALEQLHELGAYDEPISSISSHISSELRDIGATKVIPYVRQVLSYKYKDSTKIHAEKPFEEEISEIRDNHLREKLKSKEFHF